MPVRTRLLRVSAGFQRGRAVWIEGSELVFVDDFGRRRVPLAEIERVELGTDTANASGVPIVFGVIELYHCGGDKNRIRTSMMAEEKETILARLRDALKNQRAYSEHPYCGIF